MASALIRSTPQNPHADTQKLVKRSIAVLKDAVGKIDNIIVSPEGPQIEPQKVDVIKPAVTETKLTADEALMKEQLGFINKITVDIAKVTETILR
jgi:hypothetical protein